MLRLWQLIRFFVVSYQYKIILDNKKFVILQHPYNKFQFICINFKEYNLKYIHHKLIKLSNKFVFDDEVKYLILNLDIKTDTLVNDNFYIYDINDNNFDNKLNNYFIGFEKIFYDVLNDEIEIKNLKLDVNQFKEKGILSTLKEKINLLSNIPIITISCFIICLLLFILINLSDDKIVNAIFFGANYGTFTIILKEYWRLITASFIHINFLHFIFNIYFLISTGKEIEFKLGKIKYLIFIIFSMFISNASSVILNQNSISYGFSGVAYAIMAIYIMVYYKNGLLFKNNNLMYMIIINLLINFMPGIDYYGHLGGFLAGCFLYFIFFDEYIEKKYKIHFKITALLLCLVMMIKIINTNNIGVSYYGTDFAVIEKYFNLGLNNYAENKLSEILEYAERVGK